jgi:hypothetical protein
MYVRQARRRPGYYCDDAPGAPAKIPDADRKKLARSRYLFCRGPIDLRIDCRCVYSSSDSGTRHRARPPHLHTHLVASRIPFGPPGKNPAPRLHA